MPEMFNFSRPIKILHQIRTARRRSVDPAEHNITYPTSVATHHYSFDSFIRLVPQNNKSGTIDANHHESQVFLGPQYIFHSPEDLFSKSSLHFRAMPRFELLYYVDPQLTLINDDLKDYSPDKLS